MPTVSTPDSVRKHPTPAQIRAAIAFRLGAILAEREPDGSFTHAFHTYVAAEKAVEQAISDAIREMDE